MLYTRTCVYIKSYTYNVYIRTFSNTIFKKINMYIKFITEFSLYLKIHWKLFVQT